MATEIVILKDGQLRGGCPSPTKNYVAMWNGSAWVAALYSTTFTFSIKTLPDGFSQSAGTTAELIGASTGTWKAAGAISFSAQYNNGPPTTATVNISGAGANWASALDMGSPTFEGPTVSAEVIKWPTTNGTRITFTLSATDGTDPDTETVYSMYFYNHFVYYDLDHNSGFTSANIDSMAAQHQVLTTTPNSQTITGLSIGAANYLCLAHPTAHTAIAQVRCGAAAGNDSITVAMNKNDATAVTPLKETIAPYVNAKGKSENFYVYGSLLQNLDAHSTTFIMSSSSTPQNYIYWGELNKASSYTEANVEDNYATQPGKVSSNSISSRSMVVNCTVSEYAYIAYPARLGALTSIVIGGFESITNFNVDNTALAITNECGFQENYRVYVSQNPGFTDPTTMVVTI